jgi:hypothetical protein
VWLRTRSSVNRRSLAALLMFRIWAVCPASLPRNWGWTRHESAWVGNHGVSSRYIIQVQYFGAIVGGNLTEQRRFANGPSALKQDDWFIVKSRLNYS